MNWITYFISVGSTLDNVDFRHKISLLPPMILKVDFEERKNVELKMLVQTKSPVGFIEFFFCSSFNVILENVKKIRIYQKIHWIQMVADFKQNGYGQHHLTIFFSEYYFDPMVFHHAWSLHERHFRFQWVCHGISVPFVAPLKYVASRLQFPIWIQQALVHGH